MASGDARRFGFCVRCLRNPTTDNPITEHHTSGKKAHPNQVVFICIECHRALHEIEKCDRAVYARENSALHSKTAMLVSSRALRLVIENRYRIAPAFERRNRNAPSIVVQPNGISFQGSFGAIGVSGKRYYFIPITGDSPGDNSIDVCNAVADGVGGVGKAGPNGGGWIRFSGAHGGILGRFIAEHRKHIGVETQLDAIEQN